MDDGSWIVKRDVLRLGKADSAEETSDPERSIAPTITHVQAGSGRINVRKPSNRCCAYNTVAEQPTQSCHPRNAPKSVLPTNSAHCVESEKDIDRACANCREINRDRSSAATASTRAAYHMNGYRGVAQPRWVHFEGRASANYRFAAFEFFQGEINTLAIQNMERRFQAIFCHKPFDIAVFAARTL